MSRKYEVLNAIYKQRIVAVLRGSEEEVLTTARAAIEGGISVLEITMTTTNAVSVLKQLKKEFSSQPVYVGMGTVMDVESAVHALQQGADFIVTPHFDEKIIRICHQYQSLIMPGAFTITEMVSAMRQGCEILKLFPADLAGPNHIKNVKGPLPKVQIMPTGGVNESNIGDWFSAGAVAVGIGSNLTKAGGPNRDPQKIREYAALLVEKVSQAKRPLSGVGQ
ncbi:MULTISPECIES: bifunctional 4-hydroxy-2-oxoglutarate aldolase/2-dehydro-3-deoxy-phosphogluconate aldolase [Bacillaceae]|uniref:bifunctional 4-hydroxy-2-oxoglutarate aldolase/2-dehydro-3-deoxy-phosphogluconate aldolase n=1 Tax=Bacillaceae TaxID=186817 RepID=UPI001051BF7A|nr:MULTISPECIES: bifunctional 4-hydroxy-2-oxoglutarate aldolase/2-dehydro-3-deoxy-phosphogluconate aldolase [Bacillaceae]TDB49593.1 bifunctional 4-hydroxy-2-oxoglutarate aldolase/2-dehydro-3-deoxy-phosphogluconate aldolase [Bacillus sp. CBEL-1]